MGLIFRLLVCVAMLTAATAAALAQSASARVQVGVGLTPAHFPHQSSTDVESMFREAAAIGTVGFILGRWDDPGFTQTVERMSMLTDRERLATVVQLDIFEPGGTQVAPPSGVSGSFEPDTAAAFARTLNDVAAQHPAYIIAAIDVNRLLASGTDRLAQFAQAYKQAYQIIKQQSPDTKVTVAFNLEIFRQVHERGGVPYSEVKKLVDLFRPALDVIAFTSMPSDSVGDPARIPADYFDPIAQLRDGEDAILVSGWPSSVGGEGAQAAFADRLPELTARIKPTFVLWPLLHDLPVGGPAGSLGLFTADNREKPAAARLSAVAGRTAADPAAATAGPAVVGAFQAEAPRRRATDKFSISASTLDGAAPVLLASDPHREINHARVSPDGTQFVFTRYNRFNRDGDALEINGYLQTEIVVCRVDGASCKLMLPGRRGVVAANANWSPDGRRLLFVTNDTPSRQPGLAVLDLGTRQVTVLQTGADFEFADPHQVGQAMVAPGKEKSSGKRISQLFLFDVSDMHRRALTHPEFAGAPETDPPLGDHDPKLSPDRRSVAVMRHLDKDDWGIVVIDTATGAERNLSGLHPVDAVPEWSSDGRLLIFWHVERGDLKRSGLYTMRPDGSERTRVPLPPGYFYTMPAFFPDSGSGPDARIIYSAQPDPRM